MRNDMPGRVALIAPHGIHVNALLPGMYKTVTTLRDRGSKRAADDPRGRQHGHGTGVRRGAVELPSLERHPNGNCWLS
jgi:NAD(P)-dependent dehydrogenase (short-subunit alcohol dehydrogenase family)